MTLWLVANSFRFLLAFMFIGKCFFSHTLSRTLMACCFGRRKEPVAFPERFIKSCDYLTASFVDAWIVGLINEVMDGWLNVRFLFFLSGIHLSLFGL